MKGRETRARGPRKQNVPRFGNCHVEGLCTRWKELERTRLIGGSELVNCKEKLKGFVIA